MTSRRRAQNALFGVGIDARERVVEDQNLRLAQNRAREGRPLLLPAGKRDAALADHRVEALREALDFTGNAGDFGGFKNVVFRRRLASTPKAMFSRSVSLKRKVSCGT